MLLNPSSSRPPLRRRSLDVAPLKALNHPNSCANITTDGLVKQNVHHHRPPAYESPPPPLRRNLLPSNEHPVIYRRFGPLYKPIKRYFHSLDLKEVAPVNIARIHSKHRKSASLGIVIDSPNHETKQLSVVPNSGQALPESPSRSLVWKGSHAIRKALSPRDATTFLKINDAEPLPPINSPITSYFPTSNTISEGMLHPYREHSEMRRAHNRSHSENSADTQRQYPSGIPAAPSPSSNRSKTPSFFRPLSTLFNRSADYIWSQEPSERLSRSISSTSISHSRESSFYFDGSKSDRVVPGKRSPWTKIAGYVSPRKASRLLPKSLQTSGRKDIEEERLMMIPRRRQHTDTMTVPRRLAQQRKVTTAHPHLYEPELVTSSTKPPPNLQQNGSLLLSLTTSYCLLFWICPPTSAVALGGKGMLVVYAIMMLALAVIAQMTFSNAANVSETIQRDEAKTAAA